METLVKEPGKQSAKKTCTIPVIKPFHFSEFDIKWKDKDEKGREINLVGCVVFGDGIAGDSKAVRISTTYDFYKVVHAAPRFLSLMHPLPLRKKSLEVYTTYERVLSMFDEKSIFRTNQTLCSLRYLLSQPMHDKEKEFLEISESDYHPQHNIFFTMINRIIEAVDIYWNPYHGIYYLNSYPLSEQITGGSGNHKITVFSKMKLPTDSH